MSERIIDDALRDAGYAPDENRIYNLNLENYATCPGKNALNSCISSPGFSYFRKLTFRYKSYLIELQTDWDLKTAYYRIYDHRGEISFKDKFIYTLKECLDDVISIFKENL